MPPTAEITAALWWKVREAEEVRGACLAVGRGVGGKLSDVVGGRVDEAGADVESG